MENMISKIIEMDKKARDLTDEAEKKEQMKNYYLNRAKERIEINKHTAQKKADEQLKAIEEKNSAVIQKLDSKYKENGDKWVDQIVARVVGE